MWATFYGVLHSPTQLFVYNGFENKEGMAREGYFQINILT